MMRTNKNYIESIKCANELFDTRVFKYIDDNLFVTKYSKKLAPILHKNAELKFERLNEIHNVNPS